MHNERIKIFNVHLNLVCMKIVDIFVRIMHYTKGNRKLCKPLYTQLCYKLCTGSNWKHEDMASVQKCTLVTVQG